MIMTLDWNWFFSLFAIVFEGLFFYFYKLARGLIKSSKNKLNDHKYEFVEIESYSKYFKKHSINN